MTKNVWVQPQTVVQQFMANEAVAACSSGTTYWFECNAGDTDRWQDVYEETNREPGLQTDYLLFWMNDDHRTGSYHACNKRHEVAAGETFLDGYVVKPNGEVLQVLIWTEHGTNTHCTTKLDQESWEIARS